MLAVDEVIRMRDQESHPTEALDRRHLLEPDCLVRLAQDHEHGVVLRQRDRQLDEVTVEEGPQAAAAACLRLERIGVGIGRVVVEAEQRHEFPRAMRGRRAKAARSPLLGCRAHRRQAVLERRSRLEVAPVVVETVHADLEAAAPELCNDRVIDRRSGAGRGSRKSDTRAPPPHPGAGGCCDSQRPSRRHGSVPTAQVCPSGQGASHGTGSPATSARSPSRPIVEVVESRLDRPTRKTGARLDAAELSPQGDLDRTRQNRPHRVVRAHRCPLRPPRRRSRCTSP